MQFCDYIADQIEQNRYQVFIDQSQHSWYAVPQADKLLGHREAIELLFEPHPAIELRGFRRLSWEQLFARNLSERLSG